MTSEKAIGALFPKRVIEKAKRAAAQPGVAAQPRFVVPLTRTEDKCRMFLEQLRWPEGVRCPRCDASRGISRIEERAQFECGACEYQFSVRVGTAFHGSHLPLWKWFLAAYLMTGSPEGVTANQLARSLDISYKTAWHLTHRIRAAMGSGQARDTGEARGILRASGRPRGRIKHLTAYLDERTFLSQNRGNPDLFVEMLSRLIGVGSVSYAQLIASA
jgi:transposase-like protein